MTKNHKDNVMKKIFIFALLVLSSCASSFNAGFIEERQIFKEMMTVTAVQEKGHIKLKCSLSNTMYVEVLTDSLFVYTKKNGVKRYVIQTN